MKNIIISLLFSILPCSAFAMLTPMFIQVTSPSVSAVNYFGFSSGGVTSSDVSVRSITSLNGLLEGLYVNLSTAPGGTASYTYTIEHNGSDSAITCTITGVSKSCSYPTSINISAGDSFSLKVSPSGSPASGAMTVGLLFNSLKNGPSLLYSSAGASGPSQSVSSLVGVEGRLGWGQSGLRNVVPISGKLSQLYVLLTSSPGGSASYVFTILDGGTATPLTCTITGSATSCNDSIDSVTVAAGDILRIQSTPSGSPTFVQPTIALAFTPPVDGQSIHMWSFGGGDPSASSISYVPLEGYDGGYSTVETSAQMVIPVSSFAEDIYLYTNGVAPGTSKSVADTFRIGGVSSNLSCTISGGSLNICVDTSHVVILSQGNLVNYMFTPTNTPAVSSVNSFSVVIYIPDNDTLYGDTLYGSNIY
jgi:hypothetical protein